MHPTRFTLEGHDYEFVRYAFDANVQPIAMVLRDGVEVALSHAEWHQLRERAAKMIEQTPTMFGGGQ